jgi:alanine racemase
MRRTGVRVESAFDLVEYVLRQKKVFLKGIYSHFAMSETPNDPITEEQIRQFLDLKAKLSAKFNLSCLWHLANSGGISFYPESHLDMVRAGLLCYGLSLSPSMN